MVKANSANTPGKNKGKKIATRWQDRFLEELAQTSNVTKSAEAVGRKTADVYKLRRTNPAFSDKWQQALCEGYDHLEMEVLRRLREGDLTTPDGGKYDFGNALRILIAHRESAAKVRAQRSNVSVAEVRASIDRKVEEMRQRVLAREAEEGRIRAND